jgi:hypothetical protein
MLMTTNDDRVAAGPGPLAASARGALERVCSGAGLDPASRYYSPTFRDHVNGYEFHGLAGTEQSVALYQLALDELAVAVDEQWVSGDTVTSRFTVTGSSRGRPVSFGGITVSRFEGGLIVEDWSVTDTLGMLRQLGLWRTIRVGLRTWRATRAAAPPARARAPAREGARARDGGGS